MEEARPQPGSWREIAIAHRRGMPQRLAFSGFVALAATLAFGGRWPTLWLAASVLVQLATLIASAPMRRDPSLRVSRGRAVAFFAGRTAATAVFGAIMPLFWTEGGAAGRLFAILVMAASVVHMALQARGAARHLWFSSAPLLALLVGLPAASLAFGPASERGVMALATLAATIFTIQLASAGRSALADAREVGRALHAAKRERIRAEAANSAKSDFLAVMSHELRTPLNGVLGMAQVMETGELTPKQRDRLDVIRKSGEILLVLLNDLLDISRIEAAKLELEDGVVDIAALVDHTRATYEPLAEAKKLTLRIRAMETAGPARVGDPERVRQVLQNLVGNAIKFTESGRVTVVISGSPDELVFDVTDTGAGIAGDRLDTLFERFSQADPSSSRRHGGSGLGLAITRGLARLMGGDVSVRSQVGEGSVFTARLALPLATAAPVQDPAAPPVAPAVAREAVLADAPSAPTLEALAHPDPEPAPEATLRILAAEDNPTNQIVLRTLLEQIGVSVHVVPDGEAAVAAWREGPWDVVLMDIQMPVMDGLSATKAIRRLESEEGRLRTPIIAVTANATGDQAAEYIGAGMDGLVPKPIQFGQLVAAISGAFEAEDAEPQAAERGAA